MSTKYEKLYKVINREAVPKKNVQQLKSDYERQKLFVQRQFQKVLNNQYYDKVAIEADRRHAYLDFQQMEYYPTIAAALDIVAEEATLPDKKGEVLKVYSDKSRIKDELSYLFNEVLDIGTNLFYWTRNTIKNGDMFLLLRLEGENGITGSRILNKLVERKEQEDEESGRLRVSFSDLENGTEFESMQVAHFRLFGDEMRIPYGQSMLEKLRRVHKMLVVAEDAMMIKRLTRSTDRLVYDVEVGNMAENDVESYIEALANEFKREPTVDPRSGNVDYKFNVVDVTQDYFIPKRGGNNTTSINTIAGSSTLDQVGDIEYLRSLLFTGLGIPGQFLEYAESAGDGKTLANMDIRFSRKIARVQQCMVQELNKIAKIHLFMRGFEDDYEDFSLRLNKSSIQGEIMEQEHLNNKLNNYQSATAPNDATQIAPMSELRAKMEILGMSKDEIVEDLRQQFFERAIGEEFRQRFQEIDASGIFDEIIKKFKKEPETTEAGEPDKEAEADVDKAGGSADNPFEAKTHMKNIGFEKDMALLKESIRDTK